MRISKISSLLRKPSPLKNPAIKPEELKTLIPASAKKLTPQKTYNDVMGEVIYDILTAPPLQTPFK